MEAHRLRLAVRAQGRFGQAGIGPERDHAFLQVALGRLGQGLGLDVGQAPQHVEDTGIRTARRVELFADAGQHVDGIAQQGRRLRRGQLAQELQEHRHVVRQFPGPRLQAMAQVFLAQVHHGLPTVARFAVDVLEQVQRMGRAPVEGRHVLLLQRDQVGLAFHHREQRRQRGGIGRRQRRPQFGQRRHHLGLGIGQQGGKHGIGHRLRCTSMNVTGCSARSRGGAPNNEVCETPFEQPSPKVKPQEPFRSKAFSAYSRWAVGMTKRSS